MSLNKTFIVSDTHFNHERIIELCDRPFANVDEMNQTMIENWNRTVGPNDQVYHLGDFAFSDSPENYFHRLNGVKHLIKGNHDPKETLRLPWASVRDYFELKMDHKKFILFHYPIDNWNGMYKGWYDLYGHTHEREGKMIIPKKKNRINIGVDYWEFAPMSLQTIVTRIENRDLY